MKRDSNLIRQILLQIEEDSGTSAYMEISVEGFDEHMVQYHLELLYEAGYIKAFEAQGIFPTGLTMEGHDFLDAARNESIWQQAKERAKPLGAVPLEILKALLLEGAKKQLGL